MRFILRFTLSITDEAIMAMAKRAGYSDISEITGEWYCKIERPYLPFGCGEYIFQFPNACSGTLYFKAESVSDDVINRIVFIDVSLFDAEEGFESLTDGLEDGWEHGEEELDALKKWASFSA